MGNVEKRLKEEKKRLDAITAPEEMEARLRTALNKKSNKRPNSFVSTWKVTAAVALFCIMIVGYNYNAFAYYGNKLLGFDTIISGTLQELNEEGMGQIIDKKVSLADGTELTINGIMTDANQTIMYYTLSNPNGFEDEVWTFRPIRITGFLTKANWNSGVSKLDDTGTEIKGTKTFDSVSPFAKKLTLHYTEPHTGHSNIETIAFPYNPNKAMQTQIKQSIRKTVAVDKGKIRFNTITATPTSTVIEGNLNVDNFDRLSLGLHGIRLVANGDPVDTTGSGHSGRGDFEIRYDALPEQVNSLELIVEEYIGYKKLDEKIALATMDEKPFVLGGKELWVKDVSTTTRGVEITFATESNVLLDGVSIESKSEQTSLRTTVDHKETKLKAGGFIRERTMLFDTKVEPEYLLIEGIHYMKPYNKIIELPIN
ncbi:hypothetical protein GGQ84_003066 [Desulfitispora alkaliphila]|uniref:DUF4179 domain-containing protein n=1 Tax=Desulfitispora alkaliphila TaxID=622674 RepID=UPI003D21ED05